MKGQALRKFLRENNLTLVFLTIFVLALVGQAFAGLANYNNGLIADNMHPVGFLRYVSSSQFAVNVMENWQSEYLQFLLYIFATVWLVQKGSTESKQLDHVGRESDEDQKIGAYADSASPRWARARGLRLRIYSHSLVLVMGLIFLLSWLVESITGRIAYNEQQIQQLEAPVSWAGYVTSADFWDRTLQNWQSEFLAVASMVALSIFLRERGSPESKPVGASHATTGAEG